MAIDPQLYDSYGGEYADYIHAHALVESRENPQATGDGGQSFGILQLHPAFVQQYIHFVSDLDTSDSWVVAQIKIVREFYRIQFTYSNMDLDLVVQAFNLGVAAVHKGERNPDYLEKWTAQYQWVRGHRVGQ